MFKIGDIVTGIKNSMYIITNAYSTLKVVAMDDDYNRILVKVISCEDSNHIGTEHYVQSKYFVEVKPDKFIKRKKRLCSI